MRWYDQHGRPLPWRSERNPYAIWLSEIILQQTRVDQGLPYWERFLRELPTVADLAQAEPEVVKGLWSGLGYYRRADLLHRAARFVDQNGWPTGYRDWLKVPGVGPYTAGALASILDWEAVPALDGNAYRVYSRWSNWQEPLDTAASKAFIAGFAGDLVPADRPGDFNQAVMDFAQSVCVPRKPRCGECPLAERCAARAAGSAGDLPIKRRAARVLEEHWHFAVGYQDGRFGLIKRPEHGIWSGLYAPILLAEPPHGRTAEVVEHRLSHRKLTLHIYRVPQDFAAFSHWLSADEWSARGMPQAFVHWMHKFAYI